MSWLSSGLHKLGHNPIVNGLGKIIDTGADFLPPGFREVGNIGGKLMQNQNLKSAVLGAGMDYLGGRAGRAIAGRLGAQIPGASGGVPIPHPDLSAVPGAMDAAAARISGGDGFGGQLIGAVKNGAASLLKGNQAGGASAFDWAKLGIDTLGGIAGGVSQAQQTKDFLKQRKNEFGRTQGQSEGQDAFKYQQSVNSAPLRDQAQYLLMQRMGIVPQAFRPHDIYNESYGSGPAQLGGVDPAQIQAAFQNYKPGMGGIKTDVEKALLARYGFAPRVAA